MAKKNQIASGGAVPQKSAKPIDTREEVSKLAGVSHDTVAKVKKIEAEAPEEMKEQLRNGDMTINQAYHRIKNAEREQDLERQRKEIEEGNFAVPSGLFDVIAIDPAWKYGTEYSAEFRRVANPYPEMTQGELKAIKLPAAENCAWPHSAGNFISPCSFSHSAIIFL